MNQCVFRKEVDVEDTSSVIVELDGGIQATYTQCHFSPDYWRNYTFIGTEGRMENLDDSAQVVVRFRSRSNRPMNLLGKADCEVHKAGGGHGGADPVITEDFLDMLTKGKKPVATPLAGRMSVAVGCAAAESIRQGGGAVAIPPVPESLRGKVF
jgi:predicted dehydrogenase